MSDNTNTPSLQHKFRAFIPHLFTLGNLFLGSWATILIINTDMSLNCTAIGRGTTIAGMVLLAAFFDLLDGAIARKLGVASPIGKELDSLADMVTFGLVPALIVYRLLEQTGSPIPLFALVIALASAWRLAKFNIDTEQSTSFKGLATPANCLFFLGLWTLYFSNGGELPIPGDPNVYPPSQSSMILSSQYLWYALIPLFSFLLVCNLPMFSAKVKSWKAKETYWLYALIILSVIYIAVFGFFGFSLSILTYIVLSLLKFFVIGK